jgi:hypothetical protein
MKTISFIPTRLALPVFLFSLISFTVVAQKYPKVQLLSLRAPDNIKIDGRLAEWDGRLQAYNYADRIYYTISNDDNKLYLTIQTAGPHANDKILMGGIIFTISHKTERKERIKDADNISVRFPMLYPNSIESMLASNNLYTELKNDSLANRKKLDSLIAAINKQAMRSSKEIQVIGVNEITDPLISVYNKEGILAAGQFNNKMFYTYELAIPLKYLGLSVSDAAKFSYNIRLNGAPDNSAPVFVSTTVTAQVTTPSTLPVMDRLGIPDPDYLYTHNPTDFWGEYVLAKK